MIANHPIYGVIGYHVTLSEGHMIANQPIKGNTCAPSCGTFDLFVTNVFILQRVLDVSSSSVPKKYDGTSNMAEFRSSRPTPLQAMLEPSKTIYI